MAAQLHGDGQRILFGHQMIADIAIENSENCFPAWWGLLIGGEFAELPQKQIDACSYQVGDTVYIAVNQAWDTF